MSTTGEVGLEGGTAALRRGDGAAAAGAYREVLASDRRVGTQYYVAYQLSQAGRFGDVIDVLRPYFSVREASPELCVAVLNAAVGCGDDELAVWLVDQLQGSQNTLVAQAVVVARASLGTTARVATGDVSVAARTTRAPAGVGDHELREWHKVHDSVAGSTGEAADDKEIHSHKGWAILVTFLLCVPAGVVGWVYADAVEKALAAGDLGRARQASKMAQIWLTIGTVLGVLGVIGVFLLKASSQPN